MALFFSILIITYEKYMYIEKMIFKQKTKNFSAFRRISRTIIPFLFPFVKSETVLKCGG